MNTGSITDNVKNIFSEIPEHVKLVAAAKSRTPEEIEEAVNAGVTAIGENYVQEAERAFSTIGTRVKWHFIGHLQKNKVKKAAGIFDMVETLDSVDLAEELDKRCRAIGKIMPVLIEINSGREEQKFGVLPEDAPRLIEKVSKYRNVRIAGLMTMGPFSGKAENARPYFSEARKTFETIKKLNIRGVEMKHLSMGMTNSYKIAIDEGANIVRIGTKIFGERQEN